MKITTLWTLILLVAGIATLVPDAWTTPPSRRPGAFTMLHPSARRILLERMGNGRGQTHFGTEGFEAFQRDIARLAKLQEIIATPGVGLKAAEHERAREGALAELGLIVGRYQTVVSRIASQEKLFESVFPKSLTSSTDKTALQTVLRLDDLKTVKTRMHDDLASMKAKDLVPEVDHAMRTLTDAATPGDVGKRISTIETAHELGELLHEAQFASTGKFTVPVINGKEVAYHDVSFNAAEKSALNQVLHGYLRNGVEAEGYAALREAIREPNRENRLDIIGGTAVAVEFYTEAFNREAARRGETSPGTKTKEAIIDAIARREGKSVERVRQEMEEHAAHALYEEILERMRRSPEQAELARREGISLEVLVKRLMCNCITVRLQPRAICPVTPRTGPPGALPVRPHGTHQGTTPTLPRPKAGDLF